VAVTGGANSVSEAAGGYAVATTAGVKAITMGGMAFSVDLSGGNGKVDLVDGVQVNSSVSLFLTSGVTRAALLGMADFDAGRLVNAGNPEG
jgi:hypothetical protein